VKSALFAGGTFAGFVAVGFAGGLLAARATGWPLWSVAGFFAGVAAGGYAAVRMLLRSGKLT